MKNFYRNLGAIPFLLSLVSCNSGKIAAEQPVDREVYPSSFSSYFSEVNEVKIGASDFFYSEVPDRVQSGLSTFAIENCGQFPHSAAIVKISDNHNYDETIEHVRQNRGRFPEWTTFMGGPSASTPGKISKATLHLDQGNYMIVCGVPIPGGIPHFLRGMSSSFEVVQNNGNPRGIPEEDFAVVIRNDSFEIPARISAGKRTVLVENKDEATHELFIARLQSGKTAADFLQWLRQTVHAEAEILQEAPGEMLNGVSAMERGSKNYIDIDFTPGEYILFCPYPDEMTGQPHFMKGMLHHFEVKKK